MTVISFVPAASLIFTIYKYFRDKYSRVGSLSFWNTELKARVDILEKLPGSLTERHRVREARAKVDSILAIKEISFMTPLFVCWVGAIFLLGLSTVLLSLGWHLGSPLRAIFVFILFSGGVFLEVSALGISALRFEVRNLFEKISLLGGSESARVDPGFFFNKYKNWHKEICRRYRREKYGKGQGPSGGKVRINLDINLSNLEVGSAVQNTFLKNGSEMNLSELKSLAKSRRIERLGQWWVSGREKGSLADSPEFYQMIELNVSGMVDVPKRVPWHN